MRWVKDYLAWHSSSKACNLWTCQTKENSILATDLGRAGLKNMKLSDFKLFSCVFFFNRSEDPI